MTNDYADQLLLEASYALRALLENLKPRDEMRVSDKIKCGAAKATLVLIHEYFDDPLDDKLDLRDVVIEAIRKMRSNSWGITHAGGCAYIINAVQKCNCGQAEVEYALEALEDQDDRKE